jgi:TP901 family phage tail tape measure protein
MLGSKKTSPIFTPWKGLAVQQSVVLTAELKDELSAPLEKVRKDLDGTTKTVEKANKAQASSTSEAASIMEKALGRATGAHSTMATALDKVTGRHKDAMHAQEQATAKVNVAQQRLDELRSRSNVQASTLTAAETRLDDARFKQAKAMEAATAATQGLEDTRTSLAEATSGLSDAESSAVPPVVPEVDRAAAISTLAPAVAVAGGAMSAGFGVMLNTYADFDKAMSAVQAATHETTQNMTLLREEAIRVGADTAFSAGEAAQGIEELAKAGVSTKDILNGGLAGALDLAAAGELAVGEAAELAATAMTQFKLQGQDIPHIADLLAAGAGKAQGSVKDLGEALNQAGLVSAATGMTIEETTGTLAAFASAGLTGSDAGTSLKTMLQKLQAPSEKAAGLMSDLGINMYDANGAFAGMQTLAGQLASGELAQYTQAERDAAMATIFGSDAVRAANVLYSQGAEGIQDWTDAVNDAGYAALTAATMQDNLAGDLEALDGSFDTVFLKSGGSANDMLRILVQSLESVVDQVGQIPTPVLGFIGVLTGVTGGTLLFVGALGMMLPKLKEGATALTNLGIPMDKATGKLGQLAKGAGAVAIAFGVMYAASKIAGTGLDDIGSQAEFGDVFRVAATDVDAARKSLTGLSKVAGSGGANISSFGMALKTMGDNDFMKTLDFVGSGFGIWDSSAKLAEESTKRAGGALSTLAQAGDFESMTAGFRAAVKEGESVGLNADQVMQRLPGLSEALHGVAEASGGAATDHEVLNWALNGTEPAAMKAARGTEIMDKALEETGVTVGGLVEDMDKFIEQLFKAGILTMDARDATAAFHEATRGTDAAIQSAKDALQADLEMKGHDAEAAKVLAEEHYKLGTALNETKTDFDLTTAAGSILNDQFQSVARSGMADITASAAEGMGMDGLQKKLRTTYDELIKDSEAMGIMDGKADALARTVMDIPDDANINTWMSDKAKAMAEQTKIAVEAIPVRTDVTVYTNYKTTGAGAGPLKASPRDTLFNSFLPQASGGAVFEAAGGAVLPGYAPGVDDVPVLASRGESILVPELTRAIGPANIMALNHEYSGGRAAGAGPARSALSTVLGLATTQSAATNGVTASLSSFTPAAGGAVLSDYAPPAASFAQGPAVAAGQPSGGRGRSITFAPHIEISGGGANSQDLADDLEGRMRELFEEFKGELEHEIENTYA